MIGIFMNGDSAGTHTYAIPLSLKKGGWKMIAFAGAHISHDSIEFISVDNKIMGAITVHYVIVRTKSGYMFSETVNDENTANIRRNEILNHIRDYQK